MIITENLTKFYGSVKAVEGLTLRVEPGEVFGFLGPNAAGKTTTVRMLCALIGMTSGHASVAGFEVGKQDHQIRCNAGILTEAPGLYDQLSAERNLGFFAQLHDVEDVAGQGKRPHTRPATSVLSRGGYARPPITARDRLVSVACTRFFVDMPPLTNLQKYV